MAGHIIPLRNRRVFVDSSAYLALLDEDDEHHVEAEQITAQLARARYRLFTTNVLLIEAHALILSSLGIIVAGRFLRDVARGATTIVRVRASDESRAQAILFRYTDKGFSFADAISFVVMERLQIRNAFTFDRHFARYGFVAVRAGQVEAAGVAAGRSLCYLVPLPVAAYLREHRLYRAERG